MDDYPPDSQPAGPTDIYTDDWNEKNPWEMNAMQSKPTKTIKCVLTYPSFEQKLYILSALGLLISWGCLPGVNAGNLLGHSSSHAEIPH